MKSCSLPVMVLTVLAIAGCASSPIGAVPTRHIGENISVGANPEYGAYLLAKERLNQLYLGMSRGQFLKTMQLRRLPSEEWSSAFSGGDGWLVELSRKNEVRRTLVEEYSFGYHDGRRVVERELVVLKDGKIHSILYFPPTAVGSSAEPAGSPGQPAAHAETRQPVPGAHDCLQSARPEELLWTLPEPPARLLREKLTRFQENLLLRDYFRNALLTPRAYLEAEPSLKKLEVGMASGELRCHLAGSFYRLNNGYVYLAKGFLWGKQFASLQTSTGNLTTMPFGYIEAGEEVTKVMVTLVDGVITKIEWRGGQGGRPARTEKSENARDARLSRPRAVPAGLEGGIFR